MSSVETFWLVLYAAIGVVWFAFVRRISVHLREHHPGKYEAMDLANLWPRRLGEHDNSKAVFALLRFLWRRDDLAMGDPTLARIAGFMRWNLGLAVVVFPMLMYSFASDMSAARHQARTTAAEAVAPVPAEPARTAVQDARQAARDLHRAGKLDEAIAAYDALLEKWSADAELRLWRGAAHAQRNEAELALQDFRAVLDVQPANFEAARGADWALMQQRRMDEILEIWNRYLERVPTDANAYFERGGTYYRKGDLASARADAVRACELGKREACAKADQLATTAAR